ncbi:MAG: hypothetical protein JXR83_18995 [Deltaproteobacteria bacterium]|nr:hypothetical protein [Deltaproteobacteria bacterium]
MSADNTVLGRLLALSEERFGAAVGDLLASDRFIASLEQAMASGAQARAAIEKGLGRVLRLFNVPSLEDLMRIEHKLEELEELIAATEREIDRIERALKS